MEANLEKMRNATGSPAVASPYLTVAEAASYCRCSPVTIYNSRTATGQPAAVGTGRLLFTREALDRWLTTGGKARRGRPRGRGKKS